jgi:CubicO group peptidase (beta-lactamase class C family)
MPGRWHVYPEMAAAGLSTTAGDLARIGCEFLRVLKRESSPLGFSAELAAEMLKPQLTNLEGAAFNGLGWVCDGEGDAFRCSHDGWDEGFVAGLWLYPALSKGAAIMINSNQGCGHCGTKSGSRLRANMTGPTRAAKSSPNRYRGQSRAPIKRSMALSAR